MNPTIKTTPKDFFLNAGAIIAVYASIWALLDLLFSIINYLAPDQLSNYFYASLIAWSVSILVILVPTAYILEWIILKDIIATPEKKTLWIYKWRTYLTLFLSGFILICDLISVLNTYLNGEISTRFVFKVVAVLIVIGAVFKYYFFRINDGYKIAKMVRVGNASFLLVLIIATIITGFVLAGSPQRQRSLRFDMQRISDLQSIQYSIVNYWQDKKVLPKTLSEVAYPIYGVVIPKDPETKSDYVYTQKSDLVFSLCSTFSLEDAVGQNPYWNHAKGNVCFDRTIDPKRDAARPIVGNDGP